MKTLNQAALAALLAAGTAAPALAQPISLQDTFRLGTGAGVLCSAQVDMRDKALVDMFDRAYSIVCRDAAVPVGQVYALRDRGEDPAARLQALRADRATCEAPGETQLEGLGSVSVANCTMAGANVGWRIYSWKRGNTLYVAEGLTGYDSALQLALRTVVADKPVPGEISIAVTEAGDPAAFARVQAGTLDPSRALAEAYRRNNSGNYAEAAEFFGSLLNSSAPGAEQGEALINQALQQSNLGNYAEANALFAEAVPVAGEDPVMLRMLRNYRAIHYLNQGQPGQALAELDRPLPRGMGVMGENLNQLVIDRETASRLNSETTVSRQLNAASTTSLTEEDKVQILDGQAQQLRGTVYRVQNMPDRASAALAAATRELESVRGGRVTSTSWLRAQMLQELAAIAEERGDRAEAERLHNDAVTLLGANYPNSSAYLNTQARLAAFYTRSGQTDRAAALFRQIVDANAQNGNSSPTLRRTLAPYFALLAQQGTPEATADMFKASQVLVRPGVAQTQAVLARELSGGSDDAARLFRQSVNLTRDIERTRVELSRLSMLPQPTVTEAARMAELQPQLERLEREQVATQSQLAAFPRYRVVSGGAMTLAELQEVLRDGEAYYKMMVVGDSAYAILATKASARGFRLGASSDELDKQVDALRDTISTVDNGQLTTFPYDVELAYRLYGELFQPVDADLQAVTHLIFEPDGAMLRLPANLLVMERGGVDAYLAKAKRPNDDGFDFTDVKWLGKDRDVSTAVSARAFRDVRRVERSRAANDYIGFGENAVPSGEVRTAAATRGLMSSGPSCEWSIAEWTRPISSEELRTASSILGAGTDTKIITGDAFSDTAIKAESDLTNYRIMHFATHGLVTAPRPECPARPALMTSFGGGESDGLLTFAEIYDLKIDADLVILSACDTAGKATVAATREAGVTTGGDQALDGLVRAFVGAGGRSVIASHWPVPDDYDATKRLISGLFTAPAGTPTATAMRQAQLQLMRAPETSHPYYWSAFAIIGDGAEPVIRAAGESSAAH